MKTAIIYTSKHGTTARVAQMIAERLTDNRVSIIDLKKDKIPAINSFDGIILGTSVYAGTSSKTMQRFCKENLETLKQKRVALFVCGMEPDSAKQQQELANACPQELYEYAISKCFAGGEFLFEKMNFLERAIIKRIAKTDKSVSQIREEDIEKLVKEYMIDPESIALRFNNCIGNADIDGLLELMTEDHVFIDTENNRIEGASNNRVIA